jgi:hypothetical protein
MFRLEIVFLLRIAQFPILILKFNLRTYLCYLNLRLNVSYIFVWLGLRLKFFVYIFYKFWYNLHVKLSISEKCSVIM